MLARSLTRTAISQLTSRKAFATSIARQDADFTHAVVGGGVVGLAIARKLQEREGTSTVLIERHGSVGTETSSRNSEVIHAGLYYPRDSLKTKLCLRGKELLYALCEKHDIPHRRLGKWIVAQDQTQREALERIHQHAEALGVPTRFLSADEAARREPRVRADAGVLESPTTGIVDSHALMQHLLGVFEELGGLTATGSPVTKIDRAPASGEWRIWTQSSPGAPQLSPSPSSPEPPPDSSPITATTLINASGLSAIALQNHILPPSAHKMPHFAKGTYYTYTPPDPSNSIAPPSVLVYPAPIPGHAGLGTHLTLDLAGRMRFGPDVEWTSDPNDYAVNPNIPPEAITDIQSYLPKVNGEGLSPDYVGIRPKMASSGAVGDGKGFIDFWIKREREMEDAGKGVFVNLLGIESPGLTSSLAIAEMVDGLIYE